MAAASTLVQSAAHAQGMASSSPDNSIFNLGQIEQVTITGSLFSQAISQSTVSSEEAFKFNALTVDRALDLVTGAASGTTGGPRNERLFFIRGFDRFQSPLFVDGIRVYLPVDNRVDLSFFLTSNLAEIQVEKGYVSVLSGPGAVGGALNLVTRKPTQPFEYEARAGIALSGNGNYNSYNSSGLVGGATDKYYWQASGAVTKTDQFYLSDGERGWRQTRPFGCAQLQFESESGLDAQFHRRIFALLYRPMEQEERNAFRDRHDCDAKGLAVALLGLAEPLFSVEHQTRRHRLCEDQAVLQQLPQWPLFL
jgi:outer membrane receptor protein involved in Fe transport